MKGDSALILSRKSNMNNKINTKLLLLILIIVVVTAIVLICLFNSKDNKELLKVYETNEYGLMRDINNISDEIFDEYGNLTHYKYKKELQDGSIFEKVYDIKYTFDSDKKITKVSYNNNYIEITYNENNQISKLVNYTLEDELNKKYEFNFNYNNDVTKVSSVKEYYFNNEDENYTINEEFTLTKTSIDNEEYTLCSISENSIEKQVYTYKTHNKKTNFSNIFSLLDIDFEGYFTVLPKIMNSNFTIEMPVFNSEKLISLETKTSNPKTDFSYINYYDKNNNIIKSDMTLNKDTLFMYKKVNNKGYYAYCLEINEESANYLEFKDYLNNNSIITRREFYVEKQISGNELKESLTKFENYFDNNK